MPLTLYVAGKWFVSRVNNSVQFTLIFIALGFSLGSIALFAIYNNLLILSQENAKVVNVDRSGVITSTLTIVSDPGNPLDAPSQQHEGLTMDRNGVLYIVNENGGGDIDHPQLWVYAPGIFIITNKGFAIGSYFKCTTCK